MEVEMFPGKQATKREINPAYRYLNNTGKGQKNSLQSQRAGLDGKWVNGNQVTGEISDWVKEYLFGGVTCRQ